MVAIGEMEQVRIDVGDERGMGHGRDGGALAQEAHVLGARAEVEVGTQEPVGVRAIGPNRASVDNLVEAGPGELGGLGEVVERSCLLQWSASTRMFSSKSTRSTTRA